MATANITLSDNDDGTINVSCDFGDAVDNKSTAHQMAAVLLESVLAQAKNYTRVEDTAPELDVEPSRIITTTEH